MLDRKSNGLLAVVLAFLSHSISTAQQKPVEAWWLTAQFSATSADYDSVPVAAINPEWVKVSILDYTSLPPEAKDDLLWMRREGYTFRTDNQFRRKGASDREVVGVYEDRKGRKGRFLLVLERFNKSPWKVAFLHQDPGESGFSVLVRRQTGLYWSACMQCSESSRLRVSRDGFFLETAP